MANDLHGRLDNVMAADFCGFPFFNSQFVLSLRQYRQSKYERLPGLACKTGTQGEKKKRQQPEWLLPKGTPSR
jgi:hypothetical protein